MRTHHRFAVRIELGGGDGVIGGRMAPLCCIFRVASHHQPAIYDGAARLSFHLSMCLGKDISTDG